MPAIAFNQPAAHENEPRIGTFEPGCYPKSRRFAAARGSQQAHNLAAPDIQREPVQRDASPESARQCAQAKPVNGFGKWAGWGAQTATFANASRVLAS